VGVDIQVMHEKIHRIAPKFVNRTEFEGIDAVHEKEQLHLIWGAKECMYKAYGKRELRFREHMQLHGVDAYSGEGKMTGMLTKNEVTFKYLIRYRKIGDAMFVLATEDSKT
jgi:phosphopantetheinyl transferase (holo-ACP synthase)